VVKESCVRVEGTGQVVIVMRLVSAILSTINKRNMATIRDPVFFQGNGTQLSKQGFFEKLESMLVMKPKNVLLLGENHSDPSAHQLEIEILQRASALRPEETSLSLEFYDRSAQAVLDEYLLDFVDYDILVDHGQAPHNHKDYRPLIDFCKAKRLPVIAANCSRRHSRLMSRQGMDAMEKLAEESELHRNFLLPPLPIQPASHQYEANFRETMGIVGSEGLDDSRIMRMLGAQSLWDATMAHSITKGLYRSNLVVHVAGYFHVKQNLGIPEHLAHYCTDIDHGQVTVVMLPEEDLVFSESEHTNAGDLVILTDINAIDV
jgi:uncharacterized iron-regulated protein